MESRIGELEQHCEQLTSQLTGLTGTVEEMKKRAEDAEDKFTDLETRFAEELSRRLSEEVEAKSAQAVANFRESEELRSMMYDFARQSFEGGFQLCREMIAGMSVMSEGQLNSLVIDRNPEDAPEGTEAATEETAEEGTQDVQGDDLGDGEEAVTQYPPGN